MKSLSNSMTGKQFYVFAFAFDQFDVVNLHVCCALTQTPHRNLNKQPYLLEKACWKLDRFLGCHLIVCLSVDTLCLFENVAV